MEKNMKIDTCTQVINLQLKKLKFLYVVNVKQVELQLVLIMYEY